MQKLTLRFTLPALVIVTVIALAIIAFALLTHVHGGAAYGWPG